MSSREVAEDLLNTLLEKMQYKEFRMDGWALQKIQEALGTYSGRRILGYREKVEGLQGALNSYYEENQELRKASVNLIDTVTSLLKKGDSETSRFVIITNPDTYDCSVTRCDVLKEALEYYEDYINSNPILAQVLEVRSSLKG